MNKTNFPSAPLAAVVFIALTAPASWPNLALPQSGQKATIVLNTQPSQSVANAQAIKAIAERLEQRISDKYQDRLDAIAIEKRSFEWSIQILTAFGGIIALAGAIGAYRFGKSFKELRDIVREDASATFRREFFGNKDQLEDVAKLKNEYESARITLESITQDLKGYSALAEAARRASRFDPLVEYFTLDREIDVRSEKTMAMRDGDTSISISETTHDVEFRQQAAVVFERLLEAVRLGKQEGQTPKVGSVTLFNAAANASKAGLDFVSLQLMQAAFEMTSGRAPEIASRYIRQQLSMSVISPVEAKERIASVLANTSGFDLHLVVSEAFNIGLRISDPTGMATLIIDSLPENLRGISYVLLNNARLYLLGSTPEHWVAAEQLFINGIRAFAEESPTTRWYESSQTEIKRILKERPDLAAALSPPK